MQLIVGLGNPGKKFQKTHHNVGFRVIDEFSRKKAFSRFRLSQKFYSLISEGIFNNEKVMLAKPQTFMNDSGKAVKTIVKNLKLKIKNLFVVHDDIDLPLGKIRISQGRSSAGHKGVQSIINELGPPKKSLRDSTRQAKNFVRFRIGIMPEKRPKKIEEFVLQKFNKEEDKILKEVVKKTCQAIEIAIKDGVEKAQSTYNICARPRT